MGEVGDEMLCRVNFSLRLKCGLEFFNKEIQLLSLIKKNLIDCN